LITEESSFTVIMTVAGLVTGGIDNFISVVLVVVVTTVLVVVVVTIIVITLVWIGNDESEVVEIA